ncbi:hypothetical protein ABBQ32_007683 [Trebouxia sp. C0010 RCD-2024]
MTSPHLTQLTDFLDQVWVMPASHPKCPLGYAMSPPPPRFLGSVLAVHCPQCPEAAPPQELVHETILLQEVLLTAHMARAYEFPTREERLPFSVTQKRVVIVSSFAFRVRTKQRVQAFRKWEEKGPSRHQVDLQDALLQAGGSLTAEAVIGTPQRGPYHLALRQANPGTLFTDHNEDDIFAVLPLPPRARRPHPLPPKGRSPSRSSLQSPTSTTDHSKLHAGSFKHNGKIDVAASGATTDIAAGTDAQTARKSTSCKQLHFAPLQLGRTSEQPHATPDSLGMVEELISPSRSKSLGAAVERALLVDAVDAEAAVGKDRPHSATQFSRKVHMQNVTVYADEHAALQLVSQGSIQNAGRRMSRSKQEPLELIERRRSHSRASTPSAMDMQTRAPCLDFQIMHLAEGGQGGVLSRCVQDEQGLCISTKDLSGAWRVWAHLTFSQGQERPLQLQDIHIVMAASQGGAAAPNPLGAGHFQLSKQQNSTTQPADPAMTPLAHHWSWCKAQEEPGASGSQPLAPPHQQAAHTSSSCEGGLVDMACIAVKPVEGKALHTQPSAAAAMLSDCERYGARPKAGSRAGSRSNSRRSLIVPQLSTAGQVLPSDALTDRGEWNLRRRATGDEAGWRGRGTDEDSISAASKKEPCPLALWFQDACSDQA